MVVAEVVVAAPTTIRNRMVFGTFDTTGAPPRVDYCGRRYFPAEHPSTETLEQVTDSLAGSGLRGLTRIDTAPSGMPVVANVLTPTQRGQFHTSVCTMVLWVQTGPDSYIAYGLSGGP